MTDCKIEFIFLETGDELDVNGREIKLLHKGQRVVYESSSGELHISKVETYVKGEADRTMVSFKYKSKFDV